MKGQFQSVSLQCLRSHNPVPSLDEFEHLKMHISSDVDVIISYDESLSCFPAVAVQ